MLLALHRLPKLTPEYHVELVEIATTLLSSAVQGLVAEKFINVMAANDIETPAMREQFAVIAKRVVTYRGKAAALMDKLMEIPDPDLKKN